MYNFWLSKVGRGTLEAYGLHPFSASPTTDKQVSSLVGSSSSASVFSFTIPQPENLDPAELVVVELERASYRHWNLDCLKEVWFCFWRAVRSSDFLAKLFRSSPESTIEILLFRNELRLDCLYFELLCAAADTMKDCFWLNFEFLKVLIFDCRFDSFLDAISS